MKRFSLWMGLLVLLLAVGALPTLAQEGDADEGTDSAEIAVDDDAVNEVAKEIYCPVCESTPLDVCPTKACADWRELIRQQLAEGQTEDQIFEYFARQYGDGVLANPPRRGISLVILWVLPVLLVVGALLLFGRFVLGLRADNAASAEMAAPASAPPTPATQDEYVARVEEELRRK